MADSRAAQAIRTLAERINRKRRAELFAIYENTEVFRELHRIREQGVYDRGNKSKSMRKIASLPLMVDQFFMRVYGPHYHEDPDFFTKYAPEWLVVDRAHL